MRTFHLLLAAVAFIMTGLGLIAVSLATSEAEGVVPRVTWRPMALRLAGITSNRSNILSMKRQPVFRELGDATR